MRARYDMKLAELQANIVKMGQMVESELKQALKAMKKFDLALAEKVIAADNRVNAKRYSIEEDCFALIATQQPAAGDLRAIIAAMHMIVDLERMGDQAKGIARLVPTLNKHSKALLPAELVQMGDLALIMLQQSMRAYTENNVELARMVGQNDDELDRLYEAIFANIIGAMAETKKQSRVQAAFDMLYAARELERFGDLATNIVERVIYISTGEVIEFESSSGSAD